MDENKCLNPYRSFFDFCLSLDFVTKKIEMDKFKGIDIFAAILAITGFIYEVYNDIQDTDNDDFGHWAVLTALVISIFNQLAKEKKKKNTKS